MLEIVDWLAKHKELYLYYNHEPNLVLLRRTTQKMDYIGESNMGEVCFIYCGEIKDCPYFHKYLDNCTRNYTVIEWQRSGEEDSDDNIISFIYPIKFDSSTKQKLVGYIKYRQFILKVLQKKKYDIIVLLQTGAGILLFDKLITKYKNQYILDIRDYFREKNKLIYQIEKRVINSSRMTIISSKGYRRFLPKYNYIIAHNDRVLDEAKKENIQGNEESIEEPIVISFIGNMVYQEMQKKILLLFRNDNRFRLKFAGKHTEELIEFCREKGIDNIDIRGRFAPEQTLDLYIDCNLINNLYGYNTPALDYAISNKMYFAAELRKPILVSPGTYMAEIVTKYKLGFIFDETKADSIDILYEYYKTYSREELDRKAKEFLAEVAVENIIFENSIKECLSGD